MFVRESLDLFDRRLQSTQDEPGDRAVRCAAGRDHRFVGVFGVLGDLLQSAVDFQQRLFHVRADEELQRDPCHRVHRLAGHFSHALDTLQLLFLFLRDLAFDFLWACSRPSRFDRDRRGLDFRDQLHRHPQDGDRCRTESAAAHPTATFTGFSTQASMKCMWSVLGPTGVASVSRK